MTPLLEFLASYKCPASYDASGAVVVDADGVLLAAAESDLVGRLIADLLNAAETQVRDGVEAVECDGLWYAIDQNGDGIETHDVPNHADPIAAILAAREWRLKQEGTHGE